MVAAKDHRGLAYLSGGMEKAVNLGAKWREVCTKRLEAMGYASIDITALDVAYTKSHGSVTDAGYVIGKDASDLQIKSNIRHQFIYTDLRLIRDDCDFVIAYYDQSFKDGSGSFTECQAAYDNEKPLFIVSDFEHVPSWLKSLATKTFYSPNTEFAFERLMDYLDSLPPGILKVDRYGNHNAGSHYLCSLCGEVFGKTKQHFVSKVSPLLCKGCVDVVQQTRERHADRYEFAVKYLYDKE